jgi:hypothetical protein
MEMAVFYVFYGENSFMNELSLFGSINIFSKCLKNHKLATLTQFQFT